MCSFVRLMKAEEGNACLDKKAYSLGDGNVVEVNN